MGSFGSPVKMVLPLASVYPRAQKTGGDGRIKKLKIEELHKPVTGHSEQ